MHGLTVSGEGIAIGHRWWKRGNIFVPLATGMGLGRDGM